ncbi:hypothetical protein ABW19_dt0200585 [Dactylella cylindrospora]|nr:hypothetical protein ABW19_dt0200585 [Dactylella cylindrospora]
MSSQFNNQNLSQPIGPVPRRRSEGSKDRQRPELLTAASRKSTAFGPSIQPVPSQSHQKQKNGKAGSASLNSHVRSISRSVNDIFARSRSPPQGELYLRDTSRSDKSTELRRPHTASLSSSGRFTESDEGQFPIDGSRSGQALREGWLNVINSHYSRKGALKDAWKLHFAVINGHHLNLYKPPPNLHIRSFDVLAKAPKSSSRPQTAPDNITSLAAQEASTLRHNTEDRHPDLVLDEDGSVRSGSIEAICHEILFGSDNEFTKSMLLTLPAWTIPETALAIFTEYAKGRNICGIIERIVSLIVDSSFGLLLEVRYHESMMVLIDKGIKPHSPQLASNLSGRVESRINQLRSELFPTNVGKGEFEGADRRPALSLSPNEFLSIPAGHLAQQIHLFHRKYLTIWNPGTDISLLMDVTHALPTANKNPLVFTSNAVHFLGEKVCMDVLNPNHSHEFRASLLSHWIDVGQILQDLGDMVGWFSIIMAILSPALLRLQMTWQLVEPSRLRTVVEEWVPVMLDLERRKFELSTSEAVRPSVMAPGGGGETISIQDIIPYFGDLCHCIQDPSDTRDNKISCKKFVQGYEAIEAGLERWSRYPQEKNAEGKSLAPSRVKEDPRIQQALQVLNDSGKSISVYSSALFQMSLTAERPNTGSYVQPHYHQKLPLSTGTSIPLAFTELLPGFSLFNWEDTLTIAEAFGKKHFNSSTGNLAALDMDNESLYSTTSQMSTTPVLRRTRSFPPPRPSVKTTGYNALDAATHERTAALQSKDNTILRAVRDVLGVDEESFYSKDGELVLKADANPDLGSRPSSLIEHGRRPLSITSGHADAGDRPPSFVNSTRHSAKVLTVVAKGGTLERLVDILVMGVQDFSSRMFARNESSEKRALSGFGMDDELFIITFLATFRSFCSPIVLLEYLKKRLLGARSAAKLSDKYNDDDVFPDWTGLYQDKDEILEWPMVARIHIGILRVLSFWVDEFYVDFHGDLSLRDAFLEFLGMLSKEFVMWEQQPSTHEELPDMIEQIFNLFEDVREQFERSYYLPLRPSSGYFTVPPLSVPVHCPLGYLEQFVDQIESQARRAFQEIRLVDWMLTFEILEMQSTELSGFLVPKSAAQSFEDEDILQNVFLVLKNLTRVEGGESVYLSLPPSIRAFALLQTDVINMIISLISDTRINAEERSQRIFSLLRCIALCQRRMSVLDMYENSSRDMARQSVPSFVGNAIATALCSPESRLFAHAWGLAGELSVGRNSELDSLQNVIPILSEESKSQAPMTVCPAWLLDRMLEIICNVPNMLIENSRLINFDKRRYVFNLVSNFFDVVPNTPNIGTNSEDYMVSSGHERQTPSRLGRAMDRKHLKDFAFRENASTKSNRTKVFSRLVQKEHDKRKRDWKYRESVDKQHKGQLKASQKTKSSSLRLDPTGEKKSGRRLAVNTLFKAVRPISMAISSSWTPPTSSRVVPPGDLPVMHAANFRTKPVIMIDLHRLAGMHSSPSFRQRQIWKLKTEDGLSCLLQATGPDDTQAWLHTLEAISGEILITDDEALDVGMASAPTAVVSPSFGVPLETLYHRDGLKVPYVVEAMLGEVERRGLEEVGIYRVPGALSSINALKAALDSEVDVRMDDDRWYDINATAGAFKLFMREIPHNLLSDELLEDLKAMPADLEDSEKPLIAENSMVNKMNTVNLAIVFGMGMAIDGSGALGFSPDFGHFQQMVRTWITHADTIFPDPPPDEAPESPYIGGDREEFSHAFTIPVIIESNVAEDN